MTDPAWERTLRQAGALSDADLDVAAVALALSIADHPERDPEPYRRHLAELAATPPVAAPSARWLSERLAGGFDYRGDGQTYDDMRNADMMAVINRRRGLPVALGILYIHVARAQGWTISGLNFPGHFLLRLTVAEGVEIIDPFNAGKTRDIPDLQALLQRLTGREDAKLEAQHMVTVPVRHVLMRLQNNIRIRAEQARDMARAAEILRRISLFAPKEPGVWLDRADLAARSGNLMAAQDILDEGLNRLGPADTAQLLHTARERLTRRLN
ncbi:MAG: transglutaminase-like domain-containing protein [Minwuia sp.]|nr:transglutaminase-like domain-containing protein [Minwuia sp.]